MLYTASTSLIDILLSNGLKEISHLYNKENSSYAARKAKAFGRSAIGKALVLHLDAEKIYVTEKENCITDVYMSLSESNLRSILAYFKSPCHCRKKIKRYTGSQVELAGEMFEVHKKRGLKLQPFDETFEAVFTGICI
jgi:hypothetical protein